MGLGGYCIIATSHVALAAYPADVIWFGCVVRAARSLPPGGSLDQFPRAAAAPVPRAGLGNCAVHSAPACGGPAVGPHPWRQGQHVLSLPPGAAQNSQPVFVGKFTQGRVVVALRAQSGKQLWQA
jgi:hypothetical protein